MAVEFESEDAAKMFYDDYSRSLGFVMRVMSCRRSERDGRILARRFGCNKEGSCVSVRGKSGSVRKPRQSTRGGLVTSLSLSLAEDPSRSSNPRDGRVLARRFGCNKEGRCVSVRGKSGSVRKPRQSTREGCKAMVHVKYDRSGKWVVTKFVKEHNHPLVVEPRQARQTLDEKDKRIQELTIELRNKKRLCAAYKEQLDAFAKIVEEYSNRMSKRVESVVENLKEFEHIEQ
ncbi:hypothetical protein HID58_063452 [Brassica napus]|uniref:FAR1 domain-containing protein n=1 Tax=Brassica napus TaxID=3708 RepID=A0ABQ8A4B6_BRANA|nr:hypothetical protein HID58_063452 [Brassica napus]